MPPIYLQFQWLLLLAVPVACVSWTITHEEIFREPRDYCVKCSKEKKQLLARKFFYVFTCEYCLSHYVTIIFLIISGFKLLFADWRGYLLSGFSIVWIANVYMTLFGWLRLGIKKERTEITVVEKELKEEQ